jgi:hypothetical protein
MTTKHSTSQLCNRQACPAVSSGSSVSVLGAPQVAFSCKDREHNPTQRDACLSAVHLFLASRVCFQCACPIATVRSRRSQPSMPRCFRSAMQTRCQASRRHACITGASSSSPASAWLVIKTQPRVQSKAANCVTQQAVQSSSVQL